MPLLVAAGVLTGAGAAILERTLVAVAAVLATGTVPVTLTLPGRRAGPR